MPTPKPHRRKDGSTVWRVRFRLAPGTNPVCESFDDATEAVRFAALVDRVGGAAARTTRDLTDIAATDTPTVAAAVAHHIDAVASSATPGTIARYRQLLRDRIEPHLGAVPVDMLTRAAVEAWVGTLRAERVTRGVPQGEAPRALSAKTIRNTQALLSAALQRQVEEGRIPRNVAKGAKLPSDTVSRSKVFLRADDVARIVTHLPDHYRPLVQTLYGLGLRFGEATALTARDLDLDGPVPSVTVTKAWKEGAEGPYVGAPKTRRAVRTVSVPAPLVPVLREAARRAGPDGWLFPGVRGGPLRSGPFHTRAWQPAVKAAGLSPRPRVHDLRHSHASALIAAGMPLPIVQRRLGHESIQTTVDVYGHLAPDAAVQAANAMAEAMAGMPLGLEGPDRQ